MTTFFAGIVRRRRTVVLAALLVTSLFARLLPRLEADFRLERLYVLTEDTRDQYAFFKAAFARQDEQVTLVVRGLRADGPGCLALEALADDLHRLGMSRVLWYGAVVPGLDCRRPGELGALLSRNPLFENLLWNPARDIFLISASIERDQNRQASLRELERRLDEVISRRAVPGMRIELTGTPVITARYLDALERDQVRLLPAALGLLFLLTLVVSGTLIGTLLFFISVVPAGVVTLGIMALAGVRISSLLSVLPVILVVVGVADSIHLLTPLADGRGSSGKDALAGTFGRLWLPCLLTSLTTALGFLSLVATGIPMVVEFAWVTACGILLTWIMSMTLFPALLSWMPPKGPSRMSVRTAPLLGTFLAIITRHRRAVLVACGLLVVAGALTWRPLSATVYMVDDLDAGHPVSRPLRDLEAAGFGLFQVNLVIRSPGGRLFTPANRDWLRAFSRFAAARDGVARVLGPGELLDRLQQEIPVTVEDWEPLLQTETGRRALAGFYNGEVRAAQVLLFTGDLGTARTGALLHRLQDWISRNPPPFEAFFTGTTVVAHRSFAAFTAGFWRSLAAALVLIWLVLLAASRRPLGAALLLLPSLLALAACLWVAGRLGWRLTPSVVLVFSVALGLIVDNSIHLVGGLLQARREGLDPAAALRRAVTGPGVAVVLSSIVIAGGFAVLALSAFRSIAGLGILLALASLFSLVCNLVLLPALWHRPAPGSPTPPATPRPASS